MMNADPTPSVVLAQWDGIALGPEVCEGLRDGLIRPSV